MLTLCCQHMPLHLHCPCIPWLAMWADPAFSVSCLLLTSLMFLALKLLLLHHIVVRLLPIVLACIMAFCSDPSISWCSFSQKPGCRTAGDFQSSGLLQARAALSCLHCNTFCTACFPPGALVLQGKLEGEKPPSGTTCCTSASDAPLAGMSRRRASCVRGRPTWQRIVAREGLI